jgi:WD40 repeat protein
MPDTLQEFAAGRAMRDDIRARVTYDAFVSYSHARDKPIATAVQAVVQKLGKPWYRRRDLRVFRDDTSLAATPHLWPSIEQALTRSRFLILLASPEAAASRWVGQEVAFWLDHNSADTVLIALTEGELDWDQATGDFRWSEATPLPSHLKNRFVTEPRWIDLRPYRDGNAPRGSEFISLAADFAAGIRGIPKEDLLSQEVRQQRRAMTLASAATAALLVLLVAAGWQWRVAVSERVIAQLQRDQARTALLAIEARGMAESLYPEDIERAGALALESIQIAHNIKRPAEAAALEAVRTALIHLPLAVLQQDSAVVQLVVLGDGRLASLGSVVRMRDGHADNSGGDDGKIRIWPKDFVAAPEVLTPGGSVLSLAVLADGRLASGGDDGKIRIWPKDFVAAPVVLASGGSIWSLAVLGDGRLATGGDDGNIRIWPKDFVGAPMVLPGSSRVLSLAVLGNGRLASGDDDGNIRIWQKDFVAAPEVLPQGSGSVKKLVVLGDGRLASLNMAFFGGGDIRIWPEDFTGTPEVLPVGGHATSLVGLADGRLATGDVGGNLTIWTPGGQPGALPQGSEVTSLAELGDGRLASGDQGGNISIWPIKDFAGVLTLVPPPRGADYPSPESKVINSLVGLKDGRLAGVDLGGNIKIWPKDFVGAPMVLPQGSGVSLLAVLRDGRLASSGGAMTDVRIWPKDLVGAPEVLPQSSRVWSLAVLGDGRLAGGNFGLGDGTIKIWPKDFASAPEVLQQGSGVMSLAVLADGRLASGGRDDNIRIWHKDFAGATDVMPHGGTRVAALADGRMVSSGDDGKIRVWPKDLAGAPIVLPGSSRFWSLAVLEDGRLATGGGEGKIVIWPQDFAGAPEVLPSGGGYIASLAVLADGRLASSDSTGYIRIWLVGERELVAALCLRAGRNLTKDEWGRYIGSNIPWQPSCRDLPSNWRTRE